MNKSRNEDILGFDGCQGIFEASGGKYSTLNGADKLVKFCSFSSCT